MANPHGFTVATIPAVKAAAIGALQGGTGKPSAGVVVTGSNNRTAGRNYNEKT